MTPIVTLTTDFGEKDHFVGAVKGALYSELDTLRIVDISHSISPFHLTEAAYVIQNAYRSFPKGSVHIIGIDSELNPENKHIAVYLDEHYFICADNGIISLISSTIKPSKIFKINIGLHSANTINNFVKKNIQNGFIKNLLFKYNVLGKLSLPKN